MRIALAILFALALDGERPVVTVSPHVVLEGGAAHVICRVPLDARNRWVDIGVEGWFATGREIHGEDGPITFDLPTQDHAPCDAGPAFCELRRNSGKPLRAESAFEVHGCDEPDTP